MRSLISTAWTCTLTTITCLLMIQQYHSLLGSTIAAVAAYQSQQQRGTYQQQQQHQQLQQQQQQLRDPQNRNFRNNNNNDDSSNINKNIDYDTDDEVDDVAETGGDIRQNRNKQILNGGAYRSENYEHTKRARANANAPAGITNKKCPIWVPVDALDKYPLASRGQRNSKLNTQQIDVCCDGYRAALLNKRVVCLPNCEGCRNGHCIAPGDCRCYEGYVMNDDGECVFKCPLGCLNGRCYLDGSCQCNIGYKLDESRTFCRPICSEGCNEFLHQNCTEPEVCACAKGYTLKISGCAPVCDPDCGDGGTCRDTNDCVCNAGYHLLDGTCQADCYQQCVNGYCVGQNRCICKPGFTYHEQSTHCIPV